MKEVTIPHSDIGALVLQSGCEKEGSMISRQLPPMLECNVETMFILLDHDVMQCERTVTGLSGYIKGLRVALDSLVTTEGTIVSEGLVKSIS